MTEEQWLRCTDQELMLAFLGTRACLRKLQLFVCACLRQMWHDLSDDQARRGIELKERVADGGVDSALPLGGMVEIRCPAVGTFYAQRHPTAPPLVTVGSLVTASTVVGILESCMVFHDITADCEGIVCEVCAANRDVVEFYQPLFWIVPTGGAMVSQSTRQAQAELVFDLFGNPFHPAELDLSWRTSDVQALATASYEERTLPSGTLKRDRLAVLSDALEDAGCTDVAILDHLRSPGLHVRGCHILDLLLDKS